MYDFVSENILFLICLDARRHPLNIKLLEHFITDFVVYNSLLISSVLLPTIAFNPFKLLALSLCKFVRYSHIYKYFL